MSTTNAKEEKEVQVKEKCSRLVLKEKPSLRNPSFRYYSVKGAGAVPFLWEIQPGTPKHPNSGTNPSLIPPLTPPPSYLHYRSSNKSYPPTKVSIFAGILPSLKLKRRSVNSSSSRLTASSSVSSSSSSTLSSMTPTNFRRSRRRRSRLSWGSSTSMLSSGGGDGDDSDEVDHHDDSSPKSVLCFGMKNINMEFLKKCVVCKAVAV